MSSILDTAIAGINAMRILINHTTDKINHPAEKNIEKRIFLENTVQDSNLETTVKVKQIYDNYNDFITEEKRKTNVQIQAEQTKIEQLLKLEDLLCEKSNIFNELINALYEQIENDVVNNNNIINENIKDKSNKIIIALKDFDRKLKFLEKDIKESVINNLKKVNTLIDEIHDTTIDIRYFPVLKLPNRIQGFIDKRDNLVDELNDLIGVKVVKGEDSYKVYLNNGICIIDNNHKQNLIPLTSKSDDRYISIGYIDQKEKRANKIENMIPSGYLGALLKFRREELTNARNKIGQLTVNFADSINSYNILGHDVFGHIGKQFFNISDPEIISSSTNHSSPITSAKWISTSNSKDTDYVVYFKNNNWSVKRLSDNVSIQPNIRYENNNLLITFDGIDFTIQGKNNDGDIYMIKPYSKTLEKLELLIDDNKPFLLPSNDKINYQNNNLNMPVKKTHTDILVNHNQTLDEAYQQFSKYISYKCNLLEEALPFKKNMIRILRDKKISMSSDPEKDYLDLNYEQECYLANVKVLQTAERIFNEIVDCYS